jgi:hypothetical protein
VGRIGAPAHRVWSWMPRQCEGGSEKYRSMPAPTLTWFQSRIPVPGVRVNEARST